MRILSVYSSYQIRGGKDEFQGAEVGLLQEMGYLIEVYNDSVSQRLEASGTQGANRGKAGQ